MKAIEFLKLLDRECLCLEDCQVIDGIYLANDAYSEYFDMQKEPLLRHYFKDNLHYFAYYSHHYEEFMFLPQPDLSMPSAIKDNERIYIWVLED